MTNFIGIDPGNQGAIASLWPEDPKENFIWDMPTFKIEKSAGGFKTQTDIPALIKILEEIKADNPTHVYVEHVWAQPGMAGTAMFSLGFGAGIIEACLVSLHLPFTYVAAQTWKKSMSCPKNKDASRMRASQLMPEMQHWWDLKKHDGRAEAALIAMHGIKKLTQKEPE